MNQRVSPGRPRERRQEHRVRAAIIGLLALALGALTSCGYADDRAESAAQTLRSEIKQLNGVRGATASYAPGELSLEADSLSLTVRMANDARAEDMLAVLGVAYAGFKDSFSGDNAGVGIHYGESRLGLNSRDLSAPIADLLEIASFALGVAEGGEIVESRIGAAPSGADHPVAAEVRILLAPGSTREHVMPRLEHLAQSGLVPDHTDIAVVAADGSGVAGSGGLPSKEDLRMWADLGNVSFPGVVQVELIPRDARPGLREHASVAVTVTVDKSPRIERERALVALTKAHLEQLRRYSERVIYGVRVNGDYVMWIDSRDCMQGGRTWPREVTKWYYAGREDCER